MLRPVLLAAVLWSGLASMAAAQIALSACPARQLVGDLGVDGLECQNCEIHGRPRKGDSWIRFHGEPRIRGLRPASPGDGKLQPDDVIVSIDGLGITTLAGSDRYARLAPGQVVRLAVRRAGREVEVEVVAGSMCGAAPSPRVIPI